MDRDRAGLPPNPAMKLSAPPPKRALLQAAVLYVFELDGVSQEAGAVAIRCSRAFRGRRPRCSLLPIRYVARADGRSLPAWLTCPLATCIYG